jgi:hypothetical protein
MGHTWVHHPDVAQPWRCPDSALKAMRIKGWEPCEAPEDIDPATQDRLRVEAATAAVSEKPTRAARRGRSDQGASDD